MALVVKDRVKETTTTTGTGAVTLLGAVTGFQSFSAIGNANTTYYTISDGTNWEVGIGTYTAAGTSLSRDTVLSSSNSDLLVNFPAGTKEVFVTYPSNKSIYQDGSSISAGTSILPVSNGGTGTSTAFTSGSIIFSGASGVYSQKNAQLFWDNTNNRLGIGTSSPAYRLELPATGTAAASIGGILIGGNGTDVVSNTGTLSLQATGANYLGFNTNGSERMRIDSSGRFGFGASASIAAFTTFAAPATSAAAWTTSGINMVQRAATFTDTSSTGTVADIRMNNFAAQTLAASNIVTVTNLYGTYFTSPVASTNVTASNSYALGTDSLRVANSTVLIGAVTAGAAVNFNTTTANLTLGTSQTTGLFSVGGTSGTGTITLGQSTASQTTNIQAGATASGSTKTINIGTGGLAGSTTNIAIGSTAGTSTTTLNGVVSISSTVAAALGSASAPSYTFTGDTNTGIFSPAADTLAFAEGGTETMRIDSSGNVGIGTSSPTQRLHVRQDQNGTTAALIQNRNATGSPVSAVQFISGAFDLSDNRYAMIASDGGSNSTLQFWTGQGATPTERMRIDSSGNVGIGTNSPSYRLHVVGGTSGQYKASGDNMAFCGSTSDTSNNYLRLQNTTGILDFTQSNAAAYLSSSNPFLFYVNGSERMRIGSNGGVAIGGTGTDASLHIQTSYGGFDRLTQMSPSAASKNAFNIMAAKNASSVDLWWSWGVDTSNRWRINQGVGFSTNGIILDDVGQITSADQAAAFGYKGLPQNAQTASYTLALSDMGKHISITTGGVVIPANASVAFPIGSAVTIFNNSGSNQTISITTDTLRQAGTANTGSRTLAQYGVATVLKVTSTVWVISGAGVS